MDSYKCLINKLIKDTVRMHKELQLGVKNNPSEIKFLLDVILYYPNATELEKGLFESYFKTSFLPISLTEFRVTNEIVFGSTILQQFNSTPTIRVRSHSNGFSQGYR